MDNLYYIFGNYLYNLTLPKVSGNVEIFKYILGKICIEYIIGDSVIETKNLES